MHTATSTRVQRICLSAVVAGVMSGAAMIGSPATATTDVGSGASGSSADSALDIAVYISRRKTQFAQDRVDLALALLVAGRQGARLLPRR
jgi:hypothetical protein